MGMKTCYLCGSDRMKIFHKGVRDNANIDVMRCDECGLLQLSDFYSLEDDFYEKSRMLEDQYDIEENRITNQTWEAWRRETAEDDLRRADFLKEKCQNKRILDFGCGNGGFLKNIKPYASLAVGVELDAKARHKIKEEDIEVCSRIEEWKEEKFDIITMFQVIEHLNKPYECLKSIYTYLKPGGVLIIETPNAEDALISLYHCKAFMDFTFWSEHIMLYNSNTLEKMVCTCGFEIVHPYQIQRYPISNHLYWLSRGKPGGRDKYKEFSGAEITKAYSDILAKNKQCDTLFFEFVK